METYKDGTQVQVFHYMFSIKQEKASLHFGQAGVNEATMRTGIADGNHDKDHWVIRVKLDSSPGRNVRVC